MLLKIVFRVRGTQKESLKQSIMIEKQRTFTRNSLIFEYVFSVLGSHDFLAFPYTSRYIHDSWNNIRSPLPFVSSSLTECPMHKGEFFISKQSNYDDKRITGQTCLANDRRGIAFPCTTRQYASKWRNGKGFLLQRRKTICIWLGWDCTSLWVQLVHG